MKKVLAIFVIFLSSFFFCNFKVNAQEYNFNIPNNYNLQSYIENILPTAINTINDYFTNNPSYFPSSTRYWLSYTHTNGKLVAYTYRNEGFPAYVGLTTTIYEITYNSPRFKLEFSNDYTSITNRTSNSTNKTTLGPVTVFYANFPINFLYSSGTGNSITINYSDKTYSTLDDADHTFPTVYDLYNIWYGNISPPDNTPILTNFYSTVILTISNFCNSLVDNYIFISIFVIFLIIFLINLIRRYLL